MLRLISSFRTFKAAFISLIVGFVIELSQAVNLLTILNLQDVKLLNIMLGNTADPWDLVAYSIGFISILLAESVIKRKP